MPAKPANLNFSDRRAFTAQYRGYCTSCGVTIEPGDKIFYAPTNEAPSGLDCCGDRADTDLVVPTRNEDIHTNDDGDPADRIAKVMPRGKTAADMCSLCFMIHSPGQDGC